MLLQIKMLGYTTRHRGRYTTKARVTCQWQGEPYILITNVQTSQTFDQFETDDYSDIM